MSVASAQHYNLYSFGISPLPVLSWHLVHKGYFEVPKSCSIPGQIGRPQPVAASHPAAARKPFPHDVFVFPTVTSSNATPGCCSMAE